MLTAETITEEDIRGLLDNNRGNEIGDIACRALEMKPDRRNARSVMLARARCAEILNARRQG